jgi:hypothetical protein
LKRRRDTRERSHLEDSLASDLASGTPTVSHAEIVI